MSSSGVGSRYIPVDIKRKALSLIRTHKNSDHKGSSGRVVVIGGSRDYVGAPFFAAMSAMRAGVDMLTIVCPPSAAVPLKAMSPDLIVRGLIPPAKKLQSERTDNSSSAFAALSTEEAIKELDSLKSKSHAVIIGPGMPADTKTEIDEEFVEWIVDALILGNGVEESKQLPVIIDASGIPLFAKALTRRGEGKEDGKKEGGREPKSASEAKQTLPTLIITPNVNEMKLLYKTVKADSGKDESGGKDTEDDVSQETMAVEVSRRMRCCILLKGFEEFVAIDGVGFGKVNLSLCSEKPQESQNNDAAPKEAKSSSSSSSTPGEFLQSLLHSTDIKPSARRSAGQGDVLSGFVGAFLAWGHIKTAEREKEKSPHQKNAVDTDVDAFIEELSTRHSNPSLLTKEQWALSLQCAVGATLASKYSALATEARMKTGRFLTSDILHSISEVVDQLADNVSKNSKL